MPATSPPTGVSRYRRLLDTSGAVPALVLGTVARLPIGMTGLALLLLVRQETGSFAAGGLVSSAYSAALAIAAPVRGSAVDRRGGRAVLLLYGSTHPAALLGVLAAVYAGAPLPVLLALTVAAGATYPPVGPLLRSLWGVLYDDEGDRSTAYALDSVLIELAFVGGPLLVGLAVAIGSPALAVVAAASFVAVGGLLLARTAAAARLVPHPADTRQPLHAPLQSSPVRRLLAGYGLIGMGFGGTEVAVAAYTVEAGRAQLVGPVLATWATGSVLAGLAYGARHWGVPARRQYPWLVGALAAAFFLPLLAGNPWMLAALMFIGGAAIAPVSACNSALLADAAPAGATTATFAWSGSLIVAGIAVGIGVAGWLVEHTVGSLAAFGLAAFAGVLALVTTLPTRQRYAVA